MELSVKTELNPTEGREKVMKALENVFPEIDFKASKGKLAGKAKSLKALEVLKEHLKQSQIRDSARAFMLANIVDGNLKFGISKQAAYVGKISFVDFSVALGPIEIEIDEKGEKEITELIDWLTE